MSGGGDALIFVIVCLVPLAVLGGLTALIVWAVKRVIASTASK